MLSSSSPECCSSLLPGGGEWQMKIAKHLREVLRAEMPREDRSLYYEARSCFDIFISCLEDTSRCISQNRLLSHSFDSFVPCRNALQVAVEAVITVLDIDGVLIIQPEVVRNET